MARFRGQVEDVWMMEKGTVLFFSRVDRISQAGQMLGVDEVALQILAVGRNTIDGQPVSFRDCLTGKPVSGYWHVSVETMADLPARASVVEEIKDV